MTQAIGLRSGWYVKRALLFAECIVLFFILPAALYFHRHWVAWRITPIVLVIAAVCTVYLISDKSFDTRKFWDVRNISHHIGRILLTFLVPAVMVGLFTYFFQKDHFLYFVSAEPWLWLVFILFYPLLAVYPQEIVFRAFFFHRYRCLFTDKATMILLSGISFGIAHLFYANWFAPVLSTFCGMLFAYRYAKSGSLIAAAIEHGLWGNFLFTVGLGWYFYSGSIP
jgi:uncharacterized protein